VSTGGFSTRAGSLGDWGPAVQAVSVPLMLLGNFSFVTAWFLWRGRLRTVARNGEFRFVAVAMPLAAAALFFLSCRSLYPHLDRSLQAAVFETVTALTTTGFSTVDYRSWNASGLWLQIVLMLIGGGTCSTAGGIKQFRVYLLGKQFFWELKRLLMPRTAVVECPIWEGTRRVFVDDARLRQVSVFVALYLATYGGGVLLLCACGFRLPDALFEFASALGTVGLSSGITAAHMPEAALWAEMLAMFLGRLEFIVVIVGVLKLYKDGRAFLANASG
jgi:trk system potassium uptake protein TrkH